MAQPGGITKRSSTRKPKASSSARHAAIEAAARAVAKKASHEAYIDAIKEAYKSALEDVEAEPQQTTPLAVQNATASSASDQHTDLESLREEHSSALARLEQRCEERIGALSNQHQAEIAALEARHQADIEKAASDSAARIRDLESTIDELMSNKNVTGERDGGSKLQNEQVRVLHTQLARTAIPHVTVHIAKATDVRSDVPFCDAFSTAFGPDYRSRTFVWNETTVVCGGVTQTLQQLDFQNGDIIRER